MPKIIKIAGTTKGGNKPEWEKSLTGLNDWIMKWYPDTDIELIVKPRKTKRSSAQNRWLWGIAYTILAYHFKEWNPDQVFNSETVHLICKEDFLPKVFNGEKIEVIDSNGEIKEVPYTTTRLSPKQFQEYKLLIQEWASTLDIDIPDPNEITDSNRVINIDQK